MEIETSAPSVHMDWSNTGSFPKRAGANGADDHSRSQRVFASERDDQLPREAQSGASARYHDALQSLVVSRRTSPTLHSWQRRQQFASGLVVAEKSRAHAGNNDPLFRRSPPISFHVAPILSRIPQDNSSLREHSGALPDQALRSVSRQSARDIRSQEAAQRRGRWKLLISMVRHEKSSLPRALPELC